MLKNNKTLQTCLSSTAGILIVAAILLTIGIIFKNTNIRLDCTEDKLYTLSNATKNTLKNLDRKLTIRFYYSKDVPQMPVGFKNYAKRIDDMLREYEIYSNGNIRIEKLNPKPDTDAEDSANLDGISGQGSGAGPPSGGAGPPLPEQVRPSSSAGPPFFRRRSPGQAEQVCFSL